MDNKRISKWFVILFFAMSALTGCYWHHHYYGHYYYDHDGWYYRH